METTIDMVSESLTDAVRRALGQLGPDVTQALLIHCLYEITLAAERARQVERAG